LHICLTYLLFFIAYRARPQCYTAFDKRYFLSAFALSKQQRLSQQRALATRDEQKEETLIFTPTPPITESGKRKEMNLECDYKY
jgi:hypothetical protein